MEKWMQIGTDIWWKIDINFERRFSINHALPAARAWFFRIRGRSFKQKSLKNPSKIEAKKGWYLGIVFFIVFSWFFEPSWPPGRLLGASWRHLGATWGVLETSFGRLETSWAILGHLGASWEPLESKNSEKPPKINLTRQGTGSAALLSFCLLFLAFSFLFFWGFLVFVRCRFVLLFLSFIVSSFWRFAVTFVVFVSCFFFLLLLFFAPSWVPKPIPNQ